LRRDKLPSYQLAVVADDAASGVTHVLRGSDLLPSAARQSQLQEALGLPSVRWFHVPLVCDSSGRRLAKRADDLSLAELRERGVDARAIVAWAASSAGMLVPDRISAREALREFNLARVPRTNVVLCASTLAGLIEAR
jgi:glutamyl-tRNA synthetase